MVRRRQASADKISISSPTPDRPAPADHAAAARFGRVLRSAVTHALMAAIILLPALWNGFPFVFADTGGYLLRPLTGSLDLGRSALYGAFLALGIPTDFWFNIVVQALLTAWITGIVLRAEGLARPAARIAAIAILCVGTSLPWYADQLMPDVFLPLAVLAFYLLAFASSRLRRWEVVALTAVIAFSTAAHMSIYAVSLVLFALLAALWASASRTPLPRPRLAGPFTGIVCGTVLILAFNYAIAGLPVFTPGGPTFLFARLLQDGFVKTYLDRNCPNPSLELCRYRGELPDQGDDWLWDGGSPLAKLGGWSAYAPEARRIIVASVLQQPGAQFAAVLKDTLAQLGAVATGNGFDGKDTWHTEWALKEHAPRALLRFDRSAQRNDAIDFHLINLLQIPLAVGASLSLPVLVLLCWRRRTGRTALGLTVLTGLLANAAVCATFSGVNDRYQSRLVSIAVLAAALLCRDLVKSASREPVRGSWKTGGWPAVPGWAAVFRTIMLKPGASEPGLDSIEIDKAPSAAKPHRPAA